MNSLSHPRINYWLLFVFLCLCFAKGDEVEKTLGRIQAWWGYGKALQARTLGPSLGVVEQWANRRPADGRGLCSILGGYFYDEEQDGGLIGMGKDEVSS